MKKFEIGKYCSMKSACDHNCTWTYQVVARTAKTITISDGGKTIKCIVSKDSEYFGVETIFPLGKYSIAPSLTA